jgi:hypothetical protein
MASLNQCRIHPRPNAVWARPALSTVRWPHCQGEKAPPMPSIADIADDASTRYRDALPDEFSILEELNDVARINRRSGELLQNQYFPDEPLTDLAGRVLRLARETTRLLAGRAVDPDELRHELTDRATQFSTQQGIDREVDARLFVRNAERLEGVVGAMGNALRVGDGSGAENIATILLDVAADTVEVVARRAPRPLA